MTAELDDTVKQSDLDPGNDCPACGRTIASWAEQHYDEHGERPQCYLDAKEVKQSALMNGFMSDYIVIFHK